MLSVVFIRHMQSPLLVIWLRQDFTLPARQCPESYFVGIAERLGLVRGRRRAASLRRFIAECQARASSRRETRSSRSVCSARIPRLSLFKRSCLLIIILKF